MEITYLVIIMLLAACITLSLRLVKSSRRELRARMQCSALESSHSQSELRCREALSECERRQTALDSAGAQITELSARLASSRTEVTSLRESLENQKQELEKMRTSMLAEFRSMAGEILSERTEALNKTNRQAMDTILSPFNKSISDFRERVEKIYADQNQQQGALRAQIENLHQLNRRITEETTNLTNALKGNSKVQGDWGEMILETILESSNLKKGIHYHPQQNLKDEQGNNLRPDIVLNLPGSKQIVIDSKVSLTAYVEYCSCEDPSLRDKYIRDHHASMRRHAEQLGSKKYHELIDSPDFVIMFVPNEPAFLCALEHDNTIWNDAYRRKVIISSPTNLFALLKIVDDLWKRDDQNRNAMQIAAEGAKLYDKFVGFAQTLETLGKSISNSGAQYEKAIGQLKTGHGNLIGRTERLRQLGIKGSKTLPSSMLPSQDSEQQELEDGR